MDSGPPLSNAEAAVYHGLEVEGLVNTAGRLMPGVDTDMRLCTLSKVKRRGLRSCVLSLACQAA
jgi:hypothetical protein